MTKVEERITNQVKENGVLMEFLGVDNVERLKREITDAIIRQVINDLHESYDYIISPDDIVDDFYKDIIETAKEKIRPEVEKKLYEKTMAKLGLEDWLFRRISMQLQREMTNLSLEDLCELMCGGVEEDCDDDEEEDVDDRARVWTV